ncbi:MAG: hypothetical protein QF662_02210 [Phycisphaerae bacterium]|nr:hypothetical protein [Phycisphaerae bacterium]
MLNKSVVGFAFVCAAMVCAAYMGGCEPVPPGPSRRTVIGNVGANWSPREPEEILDIELANGHRILFSKKWTRITGWVDRHGTDLLADNTLEPSLELLDDFLKPITGPVFGKGRWKGILTEDDGITVVWEIPAAKEAAAVPQMVRIEETFRPITRDLAGIHYAGFSREISLVVPAGLRVRTIRFNESYGVSGTLEGHTSYELRHLFPEIIKWTLEGEKAKEKNIIGSVAGTNDRLGRFMGGSRQPFLFIDHARGNFLIYPERLDIHWFCYLSSYHLEGRPGIWPNFEVTVGSKTGQFSIGRLNYFFADPGPRLGPQRWLDAKAVLAAEFRKSLGLKRNHLYANCGHIVPDWLRMDRFKDGKEMADHFGPTLEKRNVDAVFVDTWQFIIPKGWKGKRDAWGNCQIDMLKTAEDFGGDEALKYMCDEFAKRGIDVLLWLNPQWVAGAGTSQEDGKDGSALVRLHPEFVVRNPDGKPNKWKGFYALSWASGYTEYLLEKTKYLRDEVGIKGFMLDASASFINQVDYREDGAELMMPHYWELIRGWQKLGMEFLSEEPTNILAFGNVGFRRNREWLYFDETTSGAHNQSRRAYELVHSNFGGLFLGGNKIAAPEDGYFRDFRKKHGQAPDRVELVNLRYDRAGDRWLYDNTLWVYGTRRVPYRIVNERMPAEAKAAEGTGAAGARDNLAGGRAVTVTGDGTLALVCDFKVRTLAKDIRRITVQCSSEAEGKTVQTISLWNWETKAWERFGVKKNIGATVGWHQVDRYDPGEVYIGSGRTVRAKIEWKGSESPTGVIVHRTSLLEAKDNL